MRQCVVNRFNPVFVLLVVSNGVRPANAMCAFDVQLFFQGFHKSEEQIHEHTIGLFHDVVDDRVHQGAEHDGFLAIVFRNVIDLLSG